MPTSRDKAKKDENRVSTLIGVASETVTINGTVFTEGVTPVPVAVDPTTGGIVLEAE